jgi:hypothetical protein
VEKIISMSNHICSSADLHVLNLSVPVFSCIYDLSYVYIHCRPVLKGSKRYFMYEEQIVLGKVKKLFRFTMGGHGMRMGILTPKLCTV